MDNTRKALLISVGTGTFVLAAVLLATWPKPPGTPKEATESEPAAVEREVAVAPPVVGTPAAEPAAQPPAVEEALAIEQPLAPEDDTEPINYYNGMNPEDQPRTYFTASFAGLEGWPEGFEFDGEDLRLGDEGFYLAPLAAGEEAKPRSAMFTSPAYEGEFPGNAFSPMWKEKSPEGTEVVVDMSISPDGVSWSDWFPTIGEDEDQETAAFYPDGSPNPNHGYQMGDMIFRGQDLYKYFRFSVTLYSETDETPVVSDFRLYYQDSTMGEGEIASVPEVLEGDGALALEAMH